MKSHYVDMTGIFPSDKTIQITKACKHSYQLKMVVNQMEVITSSSGCVRMCGLLYFVVIIQGQCYGLLVIGEK